MLYLNIITGKFVVQPGVPVEDVSPFAYVRGEEPILPVQFCDDDGVIELANGSTVAMNFKQPGGGALLASVAPTLSGAGATAIYTFQPALSTAEIDTALGEFGKYVPCALEITFDQPDQVPGFGIKYGRILSELFVPGDPNPPIFTGGETAPTPSYSYPRPIANNQLPGEASVFTSAGGIKFRFSFNDDGSFDVIKIL